MIPGRIRLYWCSHPDHAAQDDQLEYVQPEGHRTGHYHIAPLEEALRWYGFHPHAETLEVRRVTVDS